MARPEYCPVLSSAPAVDAQTGALRSGMMVRCRGEACALFRASDETCALGVVETVGPATGVIAPVEDTEEVMEAITRVEALILQSRESLEASVKELAQGARKDANRFQEALADIVQSMNRVSGAMDGFTRSSRVIGRLKEELEKEASRSKERESARVNYEEGRAHLLAGRVSSSVKSLRQSLARADVAPPGAAAGLGAALLLGGETDAALDHLVRASAADPHDAAVRANLAHAHLLLGDTDAAEEAAREAIRLDPRCGAAWNTLGNALYMLGRAPEAIRSWHRAVDADPGQDAAWENLKRQRELGNSEREETVPGKRSRAQDHQMDARLT